MQGRSLRAPHFFKALKKCAMAGAGFFGRKRATPMRDGGMNMTSQKATPIIDLTDGKTAPANIIVDISPVPGGFDIVFGSIRVSAGADRELERQHTITARVRIDAYAADLLRKALVDQLAQQAMGDADKPDKFN
jgi:hypothetical protein